MRIEDAWVDDPARRGDISRPQLCVQVDALPDVTIAPEPFSGGWSVGKYGPFVRYTQQNDNVVPLNKMTAGDFNIRFRHKFPVVVDIILCLSSQGHEYEGYSLPLTRARQLVRKYDGAWRLLLSDKDAQNGTMIWVPVESSPACKYYFHDLVLGDGTRGAMCGQRPTGLIRVNNVDVALCSDHIKSHNDKYAAKRASTSR